MLWRDGRRVKSDLTHLRKGEDHRRQKKIIAPAFAPSALRELTPTFFEKAYKVRCSLWCTTRRFAHTRCPRFQLRDLWTSLVEKDTIDAGAFKSLEHLAAHKRSRSDGHEIVIEVYKWMSRVTLVRPHLQTFDEVH